MPSGKPARSVFSSSDLDDAAETRSGLWWSLAEFAALAAVALAAGLIIFYVRWPSTSSQSAVAQSGSEPLAHLHAPVAADRVVFEFADNEDLQRVSNSENLRELLIEDSTITDEGLVHLQKFPQLEHLKIRGAAISDVGIAFICELSKLRFLNLPQANFSNDGLKKLASLPNLEMLRFGSPRVTDEGMVQVAQMPRLRFLHLINVPLTDSGLDQLQPVTKLESLYLDGSQVTELGLSRLLDAQPKLHIHIDQRHVDIDPRASSQAQYVP